MRLDWVFWQKNKMSNIQGFLSAEGDSLFFTEYRGGYTDSARVYYTKEEIKTNRLIDSIIGIFQPEKELFRVSKNVITDLNIVKPDPVTAGGKTYYTVFATFTADGISYTLTFSPTTEEETGKLDEILAKS